VTIYVRFRSLGRNTISNANVFFFAAANRFLSLVPWMKAFARFVAMPILNNHYTMGDGNRSEEALRQTGLYLENKVFDEC
jgi:hypothetical protein